MEDLGLEVVASGVGLRLHKMERYLQGPTAATPASYASGEHVMTAFHNVATSMTDWRLQPATVRGERKGRGGRGGGGGCQCV